MPKAILISPITKQGIQKIRVAAYCRVSSNSADQLNSYATQIRVYTKLINSKKEWTMVEIFADEGLSGMKVDSRPEFLRMIRMCELHQIDLIITKSVARFARNVKEALEYVRKLKLLGVGVQFEKEYIETALYLISTPNTGLFFTYCSIYCGFIGVSEPAHCGLSLICRLNLQADNYR